MRVGDARGLGAAVGRLGTYQEDGRDGVGAGTSCSRGSVPVGPVVALVGLSPPLQAGAAAKDLEWEFLGGGHPLGQGPPPAQHPSGLQFPFPVLLCPNLLFGVLVKGCVEWGSHSERRKGREKRASSPPRSPNGWRSISERLSVLSVQAALSLQHRCPHFSFPPDKQELKTRLIKRVCFPQEEERRGGGKKKKP